MTLRPVSYIFVVVVLLILVCLVDIQWLKDIATRVIAREVNLEETPVSKVMTKNPIFVLSDTLAVEALQKMVQGWYQSQSPQHIIV